MARRLCRYNRSFFIVLCVKNAGVQPDQQMELFRILSAILHLGNVNIQASGRSSERSYIDVRNECFSLFFNCDVSYRHTLHRLVYSVWLIALSLFSGR